MEIFKKYYEKILDLVQEFPTNNLLMIYDRLISFLSMIKESYGNKLKNSNESKDYESESCFVDVEEDQFKGSSAVDDYFIQNLMKYPQGSMANHYVNLWTTLDEIDQVAQTNQEMVVSIDSALKHFSSKFVEANRRAFASEMADESIFNTNLSSQFKAFDRIMRKLGEKIIDNYS